MPANVFLAVTPSLCSVRRGPNQGNRRGPGLHVAIGKEWWVSTHWGLGIALGAFGAHAWEGDGTDADSYGGALSFTGTYN